MKIWSKRGEDIPKRVQGFLCGSDIKNDEKLMLWDAVGSVAHAKALQKAGVLTEKECKKLVLALKKLMELSKGGKFVLKEGLEDVHSNIEHWLTDELGALGKKIHTGRSRNDQAALDVLLYSKWNLLLICEETLALCNSLLALSKKHDSPMPGYTHSRKAMIASVSHWLLAHCEMLLDDVEFSLAVIDAIDKSPLGAGASYGSIIKLDRKESASSLGFSSLQYNTLAAVGSRGKKTQLALAPLGFIMQDLASLASELILFSDEDIGFVSISKQYCTGSSIMPHKSNPDCLELVRAKSAKLLGIQFGVAVVVNSLPLGYHRDVQETKGALIEGFGITQSSLEIMNGIVLGLKVNESACLASCTKEMCTADVATAMSLKGIPFRDAYKKADLADPQFAQLLDAKKNITAKALAGGPGDKRMGLVLEKKLLILKTKLKKKKTNFKNSIKKLSGFGP